MGEMFVWEFVLLKLPELEPPSSESRSRDFRKFGFVCCSCVTARFPASLTSIEAFSQGYFLWPWCRSVFGGID